MSGLLLLAAHMIGDYVIQNDWMAANKLKCWKARSVHVLVYTLGFVPFLLLAGAGTSQLLLFLAITAITHWLVDTRRWASSDKWPPKPILVDQAIHITQLAVTGALLGL